MKTLRVAFVAGLMCLISAAAQAGEVTVKGVHLCCGACVKDANAALQGIDGVSDVAIDRNTKVVTYKAANDDAAKAGIEALADAGFHGEATHAGKALAFPDSGAEKGKKASSVTLTGVHLCCGACVTGVKAALDDVSGVSTIDVDRTAKTVTLKGNDIDVTAAVAALNKGGFHGTVQK